MQIAEIGYKSIVTPKFNNNYPSNKTIGYRFQDNTQDSFVKSDDTNNATLNVSFESRKFIPKVHSNTKLSPLDFFLKHKGIYPNFTEEMANFLREYTPLLPTVKPYHLQSNHPNINKLSITPKLGENNTLSGVHIDTITKHRIDEKEIELKVSKKIDFTKEKPSIVETILYKDGTNIYQHERINNSKTITKSHIKDTTKNGSPREYDDNTPTPFQYLDAFEPYREAQIIIRGVLSKMVFN